MRGEVNCHQRGMGLIIKAGGPEDLAPDQTGKRGSMLLLTQCPGVIWVPDALCSEFL